MKRVLVIGDSCLDVFQYGTCDRICPEAPVPVFKPTTSVENLGMATNVMENLKALGIECNIITNNMVPTKTRYIDEVSNQMLLRFDENDDEVSRVSRELIYKIDYDKYDAIVISDYNKGFLGEDDIEYITKKHPVTFLDTKKSVNSWIWDVSFLKINEKEFKENEHYLTRQYGGELIVTLGSKGTKHRGVIHPIENQHPIRDLTGAGDTFLAGFVADYLKNNDISTAIRFANKCASWVVTQKGVVVVNPEKI